MAKLLRFAAMIRVSTEKQAAQGESLRTQKESVAASVEQLNGKIVDWYGGQEHATQGWERAELKRLLGDASSGKFDAVIVCHPDRWSRDNAQSKADLRTLRDAAVRFFVGTQEQDLHNPSALMFLGMSAEIGEFQAATQNIKSTENRIAKAKRGLAAVGNKPYGRTFDKKTGKWGVDEEKKLLMQDVAKRYLAGESLSALAKEYGMNHSTLNKRLKERCGAEWPQTFNPKNLNIDEVIITPVPRLLSEQTIKKVRQRLEKNKTYRHDQKTANYLLAGFVFCAHCGYRLSGQTNHQSTLYYRHSSQTRERPCEVPKGWPKAEQLEESVMASLLEWITDEKKLEHAFKAASANPKEQGNLRKQLERAEQAKNKTEASIQRLVKAIGEGVVEQADAKQQMDKFKEQKSSQQQRIDKIASQLQVIPDASERKRVSGKLRVLKRAARNKEEWTFEQKRNLLFDIFTGESLDGRPLGVYVEWYGEGKPMPWRFQIIGSLGEFAMRDPMNRYEAAEGEYAVDKYAMCSPGKAPR